MEDIIKVSRGVEISKLGKKYNFSSQCEWSKQQDPIPPFCGHHDCIKSFWINHTIDLIRQELLALTLEK